MSECVIHVLVVGVYVVVLSECVCIVDMFVVHGMVVDMCMCECVFVVGMLVVLVNVVGVCVVGVSERVYVVV